MKAELSALNFPASIPIKDETRKFIENLLEADPTLRMDMDEVLRHPFLREEVNKRPADLHIWRSYIILIIYQCIKSVFSAYHYIIRMLNLSAIIVYALLLVLALVVFRTDLVILGCTKLKYLWDELETNVWRREYNSSRRESAKPDH